DELFLLQQEPRERAVLKAMLEAENIARQNGVQVTDEYLNNIIDISAAIYEENEALEAHKKELQENKAFAREFGAAMQSAFEDAVLSGKSLREVLYGVTQDLERMFLRKYVTKNLSDLVMGGDDDEGGGLLGGLFDKAGSWLGGLFDGFFADGGTIE